MNRMSVRFAEAAALTLAGALLLAGCAGTPVKEQSPVTPLPTPEAARVVPDPIGTGPAAEPSISAEPAPPISLAPPTEPPPSPWQRLRGRMAMPGCEYNSAVQRWVRIYTQGPGRFAATLKRSLPFMLLVIDELERQDLPGEFALLPFLESSYEPFPARGNNPAGYWQFVPDTARGAGLVVDPDYDGRLDAYASAHAAVGLLKRYQGELGDWRLVDMAFSTGEFGIKQLLHRDGNALSDGEISRLKVPVQTHEHLAKLLALSCVISNPERFGVTLPEVDADDLLVAVPIGAPIDLRLAARLAGLDDSSFRRLNAGHRGKRVGERAPRSLLLPKTAEERFNQRYASLPPHAWSRWLPVRLSAPRSVAELAEKAGLDVETYAALSGVKPEQAFASGAVVFLPDDSGLGTPLREAPTPPANGSAGALPPTHTVALGDTLWDIARRYRLTIAQLKRWNGLGDASSLRPGQKLRLTAGD